ncbi:hypothetical protein AB1Y20_018589 [Prymnesium parvum]|uniref:RING-type domain-containing protein n=1 Tax=Prymnesium parvum TaxID=97485 RepID=A0AB34JPK8_PRYPA
MSVLTAVSLTRPSSTFQPVSTADSWPPMHRRIGHRRRSLPNAGLKARPRTPELYGYAPSTPRRLLPRSWSELPLHGAIKSWFPMRWKPPSHAEVLTIQTRQLNPEAAASTSPGQSPRRAAITRVAPQLRVENREAAAASMGMDLPTYNLLWDLQHRDITPEDYETLRHLDCNVQHRTLSHERLEAHAPCWDVKPDLTAKCAHSLVDQRCSICLEYFKAGDRARRLPCSHVFHAGCIDEWLCRNSDLCPDDGLPVLPEATN